MGQGYLIDSNPIIDFFNRSLPEGGKNLLFNIAPAISIITYIEIFSSKNIPDSEYIELKRFAEIAKIYDVNRDVAFKSIELRLNYKIKLPDAIIASTAIVNDLILITRNSSDFSKIKGLEIINPHSI